MLGCCSRTILAIVNSLLLILGIAQIILVKILQHGSSINECTDDKWKYVFWVGVFVAVTALIGLLGSCCNSKILLFVYLLVLLAATTCSIAFVIYVFLLLPNHSADRTWKRSQNGYWLDEFPKLLKKAYADDKSWTATKTCFEKVHLCDVIHNAINSDSKLKDKVNYFQLGCCQPPPRCGLVYSNGSWETPTQGLSSPDSECLKWQSLKDVPCYECNSCKAGYLATFQLRWQNQKTFSLINIAFLLIASILTCYAL